MNFNNTALIIVAMQNAFCSPEGSFQKRLQEQGKGMIKLHKVITTIKSLVSYGHCQKWLVIFTKLAYKPDYSDAGLLVKSLAPEIKELKGYIENTWDSKIIKELTPKEDDIILIKKRYDPFYNTSLEKILKKSSIRRVIIAGVLTNVCVESCVRSAFDRDFAVIVIKDATSTYSEELYQASLTTIETHFAKVISFKELENLWIGQTSKPKKGRNFI